MSADHLNVEDFARFLRNPREPGRSGRNTQLVKHLLRGCSPCQENLRTAVPKHEQFEYGAPFEAAEHSLAAFLAKEATGPALPEELLAEVSSLPAAEQAARVMADDRFAFPAFVRQMVDESHAIRYRNPARMLHLANLARLAAQACSAETAGSEARRSDLLAQGWRQYGNALRVLGRLHEADPAIAAAWSHWEEGTRDPLLRAELCTLATASLRMAQRRFPEAIELCEDAERIYAELGDDHGLAISLVQKAIVLLYSGDAEEAVRTLNQAIPRIDADKDPQLLLAACHNLVRCYAELGRPEHALSIYSEMRDLYRRFDDPLIRLRAAWQEALLLRDLGHLRAAETALLEIRQGFIEREILYEAAVVSLDLASVYVKLQAESELKKTVAETMPIFKALGVGREFIATLLQLQQLPQKTRQALDLLHSLSSRLEKLSSRQNLS
jgi:pentatricopeptide repeat protein